MNEEALIGLMVARAGSSTICDLSMQCEEAFGISPQILASVLEKRMPGQSIRIEESIEPYSARSASLEGRKRI